MPTREFRKLRESGQLTQPTQPTHSACVSCAGGIGGLTHARKGGRELTLKCGPTLCPLIKKAAVDFTVSERVEIGKALEVELGKRQGQRTDMQPRENFPEVKEGRTRDLAAKAAGFGNGKTYEQAWINPGTAYWRKRWRNECGNALKPRKYVQFGGHPLRQ